MGSTNPHSSPQAQKKQTHSHGLEAMQIPVCEVFASNGFQIEYMPDFLSDEDFDNHSPHVHSFYEILWFQQGEGHHVVDFADYEVKPNTIFFLAPGQIHHFDHNTYKGVSIKMCVDFMELEEDSNGSVIKYNIFHNFDSTPCFQIDDNTAASLDNIVAAMEQETTHDNHDSQEKGETSARLFGNVDMLQSLVRIFLILIYRHGTKESTMRLDVLKPSHQLFVRFRGMVEKEYRCIHSVKEYADRLNTNVRSLNKCVNECVGMSPLAFINARIMLEAKRLVRYSNMMIKEVAFRLGYDDPSYFVRMFKRHTGYMPTEFRESDNILY